MLYKFKEKRGYPDVHGCPICWVVVRIGFRNAACTW